MTMDFSKRLSNLEKVEVNPDVDKFLNSDGMKSSIMSEDLALLTFLHPDVIKDYALLDKKNQNNKSFQGIDKASIDIVSRL